MFIVAYVVLTPIGLYGPFENETQNKANTLPPMTALDQAESWIRTFGSKFDGPVMIQPIYDPNKL